MREGKITYRKVGDSTRFWREDLDAVMQVFRGEKDLEKAREFCPACHHAELVDGKIRGTGLIYFSPRKTKFWTLKQSLVETQARMCARCGAISLFGDPGELAKLRVPLASKPGGADAPKDAGE